MAALGVSGFSLSFSSIFFSILNCHYTPPLLSLFSLNLSTASFLFMYQTYSHSTLSLFSSKTPPLRQNSAPPLPAVFASYCPLPFTTVVAWKPSPLCRHCLYFSVTAEFGPSSCGQPIYHIFTYRFSLLCHNYFTLGAAVCISL